MINNEYSIYNIIKEETERYYEEKYEKFIKAKASKRKSYKQKREKVKENDRF